MNVAAWRADIRQITGAPYDYYGYIVRFGGGQREHCHLRPWRGKGPPVGRHRGAVAARRCAEKAARRLNRGLA